MIKPITEGLEKHKGWWRSLHLSDFDNDGDKDFFAGNIGKNHSYNISIDTPLMLIAEDFDGNGFIDPILFSFQKDLKLKSYPFPFWRNLYSQSPYFRNKFKNHSEFGKVLLEQYLEDEKFKKAQKWNINFDASFFVENKGNGTFKMHLLPSQAQWAPIFGFTTFDNPNTTNRLLVIGNDYGNEPFIGPLDALQGLLLTFDHDGFTTMEVQKSGFKVTGNARDIITLYSRNKTYYVVTQNNGPLLIFTKK